NSFVQGPPPTDDRAYFLHVLPLGKDIPATVDCDRVVELDEGVELLRDEDGQVILAGEGGFEDDFHPPFTPELRFDQSAVCSFPIDFAEVGTHLLPEFSGGGWHPDRGVDHVRFLVFSDSDFVGDVAARPLPLEEVGHLLIPTADRFGNFVARPDLADVSDVLRLDSDQRVIRPFPVYRERVDADFDAVGQIVLDDEIQGFLESPELL